LLLPFLSLPIAYLGFCYGSSRVYPLAGGWLWGGVALHFLVVPYSVALLLHSNFWFLGVAGLTASVCWFGMCLENR